MKTTLEILTEARTLVDDGWTQGAWARHHNGNVIGYMENAASCFCVEGAIRRVTKGENREFRLRFDVFSRLKEAIANELPITDWNDAPERTKEEVIAAFDRAIALETKLQEVTNVAA